MIYRWQQGASRPLPEIVEILAQIGREEAHLPREWGESLLKAAYHPEAAAILSRLWGAKEIRPIPNNLPAPEHNELIGRQAEIDDLLKFLSPNRAANLITVDGIGGVGKTALVLNVAYRCLKASTGEVLDRQVPTFDAIIFVTAKQQSLTPTGILPRYETKRTFSTNVSVVFQLHWSMQSVKLQVAIQYARYLTGYPMRAGMSLASALKGL
jgi:hypothetical protein